MIERIAKATAAIEQLTAQRRQSVADYEARVRAETKQVEEDRLATLERVAEHFRRARDTEALHAAEKAADLAARDERDVRAVERQHAQLRQQTLEQSRSSRALARRQYDESAWQTNSAFDATKDAPEREFQAVLEQVEALVARLEAADAREQSLLILFHQPLEEVRDASPTDAEPIAGKRLEVLLQSVDSVEQRVDELSRLRSANVFVGLRPLGVAAAVTVASIVPAGLATAWQPFFTIVGTLIVATILTSIVLAWIYYLARRDVRRIDRQIVAGASLAAEARRQWQEAATARMLRQQAEIADRRKTDLARAAARYVETLAEIRVRRASELRRIDAAYRPRIAGARRILSAERARAETSHADALGKLDDAERQELARVERDHRGIAETVAELHREAWRTIVNQWRAGLDEVSHEADGLTKAAYGDYPPWDDAAWHSWQPRADVAAAFPLGRLSVSLDQFEGGVPEEHDLARDLPERFELPAAVELPERGSLVLKAAGAGRAAAVPVLQNVCLRMLVGVPPSKLRFTFVDPVGLGENFAGFMHLADYDPELVSSRIWTEPNLIEQRLADLTAHMANVIQKYLRNEFASIDEYNHRAGEVAEPYRVLVVANFPVGFTDTALRHLVSIATTGARCGVYVLLSVDAKQPTPGGFRMADLEQNAMTLVWRDGKFAFKDERLTSFPLDVDPPPAAETCTRLLHVVGAAAKSAGRVEVPFEFIADAQDLWWKSDSRGGVDVPLGRAGATKRQHLRLGEGTAQHVLIAGKTGSGKSTLLHTLITNAALRYSPDEIELYLVDFKKGVEFKTYATWALPQARVVAVESEREFGLSVLERLDALLRERGERFRAANVQDIAGFRQAFPGERMPRVMLVVDEFQEFFVEDDRVAQDASLLLDRLVRQGRAFGIHIHLGSQTLAGAYSLARSTLGQMGVRVALQSSETDAPLILSEDNTAARLLGRPGEAIYNDAGGRLEGNSLFQIAYLPDSKHEDYLRRLRDFAAEQGYVPHAPQIVFEGNVPADLANNHLFRRLVEADDWHEAAAAPLAWLGEAIAIKDPTAAVFRRQGGSNLLVVGQRSEGALAVLMSALASLAAQSAPASADDAANAIQFYVLDAQESTNGDGHGRFADLTAVMPHAVRVGGVHDAAALMADVAAEVERRGQSRMGDMPGLFVIVHDLARFRALKRQDDDFGFSRSETVSAAQQFATVLRDGPQVGVHVLAWCDTLANLNRMLDRASLREFDLRVLFQMSATDSSHLMDSPAAGKLGAHRALFCHEAEGRVEKFRPYGLPSRELIDWLARRFQAKAVAAERSPTGPTDWRQ